MQNTDIDLISGQTRIRTLPGETYRLYPGGSALGMYPLLQEMKPGVDPFSPENLLIFSVSPLTGLPVSGQSGWSLPKALTGTAGDSQAGGFMPVHIKGNGYDSIIIRGKAQKPVYIYIDGENVQIRDAQNAWGKVTGEAEKIIKEDLGEERVEIAQIGPAGEKLVRYACILNMCNRANGRNGTGAVMGSKNLKALVVKKTKPIKPVDRKDQNLTQNVIQRIKANPNIEGLGEHGTDGELEGITAKDTSSQTTGRRILPIAKNHRETMTETILIGRNLSFVRFDANAS